MDSFRKTLKRIFDIREGELLRVLLMFSYLLLIIGSYVTTKAVRDALFLKRIGIEQLPYVFILIALVVGIISSGYARLAARSSLSALIRTTSLIAISNLLFFWLALHRTGPWMFYVLYIWVSVFGVITASQFWLLANYVFNPREAKRLFALIGAGGVLGGIMGGAFTRFGAHWFGTENLLLWCMGFMLLTILILERLSRERSVSSLSSPPDTETGHGRSQTRRLLKLIWGSRHLTMLTVILGITVIVESFVDYQLKFLSDAAFGSQDQLTSFFGTLFAYLGTFSLIFQIFLTGRILKRFGVGASLLFLPVGLFIGSLVLAFAPSLLAVGFLKVSDGSFRYSIHRSGVELLYLPISTSIKNQVKGFIDMFIDRFGRGLGGLLLIFCSQVVTLSVSQLSLLVCGMIGVWIFMSIIIRHEYLNTFRLALEKKQIEPETLRVSINDSATLQAVLRVLESPDERQVLYALSLLEDVSPSLWFNQAQSLVDRASPRIRALSLERLAAQPRSTFSDKVRQCLKDSDLGVRVEAVHYLCLVPGNRPEVQVKEFIESEDYAVVSAAIQAISKYGWNPEGLIHQSFIEKALQEGRQREEARIAAASALGLVTGNSPLQSFLKVLLEDESVEVVRNAVRSCGQIQSRDALPQLVRKLGDPWLRSDVREALLRYGTRIIGTLCDYLNDTQESLRVRAEIPKVLSRIHDQQAVNGLVRALHHLSPFLGYRVIKALNKMRVEFPHLSFADQNIDLYILEELKDYYQFTIMLHSQDLVDPGRHAVLLLLKKALQERMDQKLERVFRLLGLRYPPKDIYSAYNGLRSPQSNVRASAVEFLDNLLLSDMKQLLFPILEESAVDTLLAQGGQHFGLERRTRTAYLDQLIHGRDEWLQTISLYVAGSLGLIELLESVRTAESSPSEYVRETARRSLRMLEGSEAVV